MEIERYKLKHKQFSENLNWILFVEGLNSLVRIDLTREYRLEFREGALYLKDGWKELLIEKENLSNWISYFKIFLERCIKLNKENSDLEIDFPIVNRIKRDTYCYFFRYSHGKLFLDIRRGQGYYDETIYNYRLKHNMQTLMSTEIPMEKVIKIIKTKIEAKRNREYIEKRLESEIKKIDKQKLKW